MTQNKQNPFLNLYLGKLKQPWLTYCARLGKRPGTAIKEAIQAQLLRSANQAEFNKPIFNQLNNRPDKGKKKRLVLQLTPTENEKVALLAEFSGCSSQRWVTNLLRIFLTRQPQCDMRELQTLGKSNYQLLALEGTLTKLQNI